jgi:alcohol dehydrogenase class IV
MRILIPSDIRSAPGASAALGGAIGDLACVRPLVVADPVVLSLGLAGPALASLAKAGMTAEVYSGVSPDPTDAEAIAAAAAAREARADCVVGIGGGSAMDVAKVAALLARHPGVPRDFAVPRIVDLPALPIICIPTTAGTGSEVTRAAVITDAESHEKLLMLGKALLPAIALLDVELTMSCPFRVTADSGLDALSHALEALVNRNATPFSDGVAFEALALIGGALEKAAGNPGDRDARAAMLTGAMLAGVAVSHTSTALIHGMSRPIGAAFRVPHGMSNAMLMPLVSAWSLEGAPQRYARAAQALAAGQEAGALLERLEQLNRVLEVPTLAGRGIGGDAFESAIPEMARQAIASGTPANNPRLATQDDVQALYRQLWVLGES